MSPWHSQLQLHFRADADRTMVQHRHQGGLRVLASLYPEAARVCHQVLVHPPGGLVGGDVIAIETRLQAGTHALVTTPGASRFYRSTGAPAAQTLDAHLGDGARLEWLPLETLAYNGCLGENRSRFILDPGAELITWDMLALGLPAAGAAFRSGGFTQHIELPGLWLERGHLAAGDTALLHGPGGLDGRTALATLVFACGSPIDPHRRDALLDAARHVAQAWPAPLRVGATSPHPQVVVLRALADRIEPVAALLRDVWAAWRHAAWALPACPPRVWAT